MGDLVNIDDFRKAKPAPTVDEVVAYCKEAITDEWERYAKANKLNDYFSSGIGMYVRPFTNYLADLTELAAVEKRLDMMPGVWGPGINGPSQLGWRACFRFGDVLVESPDMMSEHYARCFNVLVFMKLKREMVTISKPRK